MIHYAMLTGVSLLAGLGAFPLLAWFGPFAMMLWCCASVWVGAMIVASAKP